MNTPAEVFFGLERTKDVIRRFDVALKSISAGEIQGPNVLPYLQAFIQILNVNVDAFDRHCACNISWVGNKFVEYMASFVNAKREDRDVLIFDIFLLSYRFICELDFSMPDDLADPLRTIKDFVAENISNFNEDYRRQLIYAGYIMPVSIAKKLMHSPALSEFKSFSETASMASNMKKEWDKEIEVKNDEIRVLREGLERVKTTYNFVGLVHGFESMAGVKKKERKASFISLLLLGVVMVAPVLTQLCFTLIHIDSIESHRNTLVYSLPSLIALEVILLYVFRIVLLNFKNVSAQLLQLNLRISLCQFIQSYSDYSSAIKKQDANALDKFENIIFSGINPDSGSIPSTFDGVDQIAKLISSLRSGRGVS